MSEKGLTKKQQKQLMKDLEDMLIVGTAYKQFVEKKGLTKEFTEYLNKFLGKNELQSGEESTDKITA